MFSSLARELRRTAGVVWTLWRWLLQSLLGGWTWEAPPWGRWLARQYRRYPRAAAFIVVAFLAGGAGAVGAWHWYEHLPKAELASFAVAPPGPTRIEKGAGPPGAGPRLGKPDPLAVHFDRSVASLAAAGKELPTGIGIAPALAGTWRWLNDRDLEFRVEGDWPIGQAYKVTFVKSLFGPKTRLASYGFSFSTAPFEAHVAATQLYQDPVNPGLKQGVFDIALTHPVEPAEFEHRIELRMAGQNPGVLGVGRESTAFTVVYDKLKLGASIHSVSLPIPKDPTELQLRIDAGMRAARGGNRSIVPLTAAVRVPGRYSLSVSNVEPVVVDNDRNEPEQILLLNLSAATGARDVAHAIKAWMLPKIRPASGMTRMAGREDDPYHWRAVEEITDEVLAQSEPLTLSALPATREFLDTHSFHYHAEVGRDILVQVDKNLRSFGGYLTPSDQRFIVRVPAYPPQLKLLSQGSLLALSGDRKVVALVRDLPGVRVDIGRVLPDQLQHLVSQSDGDFSNPVFTGSFGPDNVVERFVRKVPLPSLAHGEVHYETIDLGPYLATANGEKRGLFLLTVQGFDPAPAKRRTSQEEANPDAPGDANPSAQVEKRLVLVTDLGILVKKSADGSQDVFVQSIHTGQPVAAAAVAVVAKNGSTLFTQTTDADGRAHFARLDGLKHERAALFVQVTKAGDLSFLPLNRADRTLDYSRFDVGGIRNARNPHELSAYLFSDRGLYRPGDTIHVGMIARTADWSAEVAGIPLEAEILDARGLDVKRERIKLPAGGFAEISYDTAATAPTGTYTVNLYIVKDDLPGALVGSTSLRVQEFEPDRMKVVARFSAQSSDGWVNPRDLKARVNVQNLFGSAAQNRRVEASLTLTPAYPEFRALPDYHFYDPSRANDGYEEKLADSTTDSAGDALFDLGLQKYAKATYRVHLLARAFEPDSGRSVAADTAVLVSELPFLVGYKSDGELNYIARGSPRIVSVIAIDPAARRAAAAGLTIARLETGFVSVLNKQPNGTYQYESQKKETVLSSEPFVIPASGAALHLSTDLPGTFSYVIRDAAGLEMNRVQYTVAGQGNVTRSLERNAELQMTLNKKDYAPGDDIELSIKAPYSGSGLITIERDHVYAAHWFKSDTTASVQKIHLPADFEGNGYVSVQFIRDPASDEIFTSPLSYGIAPFMTRLATRTNDLKLDLPALVKPGDTLHMQLKVAHRTRVVVFAVDEGILQVAHYPTPDPLGEFFKKRALEVRTSQILDLILPEFKRIMAAAAPGGDGEAALRRNLNPFKRKHEQPAAYWSGVVAVDGEHEFTWTVPESFNGSLKVFAVAVDATSVGIAHGETVVRGDFVLTPNMPTAVAPGDEFDVSVGVTNGVPGSGAIGIAVSAEAPAQLEALGSTHETLTIDSMHEAAALFRFRARAQLGSAPVTFKASWQAHSARLVSAVSVRPASPYVTDLSAGFFGTAKDIPLPRVLYPDYRKLRIGLSASPLILIGGLADYLDEYPHLCTEQLVSRGFSALIVTRYPELGRPDSVKLKAGEATAALISVLRNRQNAAGGFGLWSASVNTDEFASVYTMHWLVEARERGETVPDDLLQRSLAWLQPYASSPVQDDGSSGLDGLRNRAYAAYLLTRLGMITTPIIAGLRETLDARYPREWNGDLTAAYLAAAYQMQKQDPEASALIEHSVAQFGKSRNPRSWDYYDDTVRDAQVLYLLSRHFPARARALDPHALETLATPLGHGEYNTLSSALLGLAFDAYAANTPRAAFTKFSASESMSGKTVPLPLSGQELLHGTYDGDVHELHLTNDSGATGFFAITNAGFDRQPPNGLLADGMEMQRDYLDAAGRPLTSVKIGDEVTVRLRMRALAADFIAHVAVTDLLPGGFELSPARGGAAGGWTPEFVDLREDRVVLYGSLSKNMAEYAYRIRATNTGTFSVPPSFAESMYDRRLRARTLPGSVTVHSP